MMSTMSDPHATMRASAIRAAGIAATQCGSRRGRVVGDVRADLGLWPDTIVEGAPFAVSAVGGLTSNSNVGCAADGGNVLAMRRSLSRSPGGVGSEMFDLPATLNSRTGNQGPTRGTREEPERTGKHGHTDIDDESCNGTPGQCCCEYKPGECEHDNVCCSWLWKGECEPETILVQEPWLPAGFRYFGDTIITAAGEIIHMGESPVPKTCARDFAEYDTCAEFRQGRWEWFENKTLAKKALLSQARGAVPGEEKTATSICEPSGTGTHQSFYLRGKVIGSICCCDCCEQPYGEEASLSETCIIC
jgi:hypothetical protein